MIAVGGFRLVRITIDFLYFLFVIPFPFPKSVKSITSSSGLKYLKNSLKMGTFERPEKKKNKRF